ncbi:protein-L-isoaspartate O-methyltransferase family protein [Hyphobacterium sp.]|uniref:protein-L-isoaspartate O-methyltransferase family protein n=1 Tax=Hyphobacterium sp. TaxID=2004662 RepID=UPI003BABF734
MLDLSRERDAMVDSQVHTADVTERRLLRAMRTLPREIFMPKSKRALAYADCEVEAAPGRWMMRPRELGMLIQAADIDEADLVLNIASGRGYAAAVISRLAETVVGVESDEGLIEKASASLAAAGCDNAAVIKGNLREGAPGQGPYDVVFVEGAVEETPRAWFDQLKDGGRLAVVIRQGHIGKATIFTRSGETIGQRVAFDATPRLIPGFKREAGFVF